MELFNKKRKMQRFFRMKHHSIIPLICLFALTIIIGASAFAVAPHPDLIEKWKSEGVLDEKLADLRRFREAGGCSPEEHTPLNKDHLGPLALGADMVDTAYVIVILVDFSDNPMSAGVVTTPAMFDSVLFSDNYYNPTGSMTDYYKENSYGTFVVKGDIYGPYRMPYSYAWYVSNDNGMSRGRYLAEHALDSAALYVPTWWKYDSNLDSYCDGLVIIHAGVGAEQNGSYGIWSHKGNISTRVLDGVSISAYTMNPEEFYGEISPIGVFTHEYGHFLGLPDLYDVSDGSTGNGLGNWSLMATGSYNNNSRQPSHLTAWSKAELDFLSLTEVTENMIDVDIPSVEDNPVAFMLQNDQSTYYEYWIVENRQPVGFDVGLPNFGLCIYHVDRHAPGPSNQNPDWYRVALEQADGDNDLAYNGSRGDGGDCWPGTSDAREFHDRTVPNTHTNAQGPFANDISTRIGVWNISDPGPIMTADFDIDWSRPWPEFSGSDSVVFDDSQPGGDGDGILEPGETIGFYCTIKNSMRLSYNARVRLESSNPAVIFNTDEVLLAPQFDASEYINLTPITFTLAPSFIPAIDSFYLTVECDSTALDSYTGWTPQTFGLEVILGAPQVLIVDDDRGNDYENVYIKAMYDMKIPYEVWTKANKSSPTGEDLKKYPKVFWFTGDSASNVFTADDVAAMKEYLDAGGNLMVSSISGAKTLNDLDPGFLNDYFAANWQGSKRDFRFNGVSGSQVGDGTKYRFLATVDPWNSADYFSVLSGGQASFTIGTGSFICGVSKASTYNSILLTFPIEQLGDDFSAQGYNTRADLFARIIDFFGGIPLVVDDGTPHAALPQNFDLDQNYPNPFNPSTTISYTLRRTSGELPRTTLSVYNMLGRRVVTLVDEIQLPGSYQVEWDGTTSTGKPVASGVYFYKLSRGGDSQAKKMILLK